MFTGIFPFYCHNGNNGKQYCLITNDCSFEFEALEFPSAPLTRYMSTVMFPSQGAAADPPSSTMSYGSLDGSSFATRNPFGGPSRQGYQPVGRKECACFNFLLVFLKWAYHPHKKTKTKQKATFIPIQCSFVDVQFSKYKESNQIQLLAVSTRVSQEEIQCSSNQQHIHVKYYSPVFIYLYIHTVRMQESFFSSR